MRKCVYLCFLIVLIPSMGVTAQVIGNVSWIQEPIFSEDFSGTGRGWGRNYNETNASNPGFRPRWQCYYDDYWPSGVTLDTNQHQIFQRSQCLFNDGVHYSDGVFRIFAQRIDITDTASAVCGEYEIPYPTSHYCDSSHYWLYYYSGCIETIQKFLYGYFEIRCKNPISQGAFPAFWLWGNGTRKYEEIDIYEYMWDLTNPDYDPASPYLGYPYVFTTGIWFNENTPAGDPLSYARKKVFFSETSPDISNWHTFGCEWSPGLVIWYFDGEIVNENHVRENIPSSPMRLIADYVVDRYACEYPDVYYSNPEWKGTDTLKIDYIKVYNLDVSDCDVDVRISNTTQLQNHNPRVKHSISIGSTSGSEIVATQNTNVVMRASEYIVIDAPVYFPLGSEITFLVHGCPTSNYSN